MIIGVTLGGATAIADGQAQRNIKRSLLEPQQVGIATHITCCNGIAVDGGSAEESGCKRPDLHLCCLCAGERMHPLQVMGVLATT